jgi:ribosomal 50S subunit-recycling heat shock protein
MAEEFRGYPSDYYKKAIECGRIRINGEKVDPLRRVQSGDKITYHFSFIVHENIEGCNC